jgi:hypothetical protein
MVAATTCGTNLGAVGGSGAAWADHDAATSDAANATLRNGGFCGAGPDGGVSSFAVTGCAAPICGGCGL